MSPLSHQFHRKPSFTSSGTLKSSLQGSCTMYPLSRGLLPSLFLLFISVLPLHLPSFTSSASLLKCHLLQETIFWHPLKTASHKTLLILFLALVIFLCISFIVYLPRWMSFPCGLAGKDSVCSAGDLGSVTGLGRSPGEGKGYHSSILAWRIPWTV